MEFDGLPQLQLSLASNASLLTSEHFLKLSPLHALMKDRIESLTRRSVSAAYAGDANSDAILLDRIAEGKYQFVYISPEMLLTDQQWRDMIVTPVYK